MSDRKSFSIRRIAGTSPVVLPNFRLSCQVFHEDGTVDDFIGPNSVNFPAVLAELNADDLAEVAEMVLTMILEDRSGDRIGRSRDLRRDENGEPPAPARSSSTLPRVP